MGIVVIGAVFVDIKGFPEDIYVPEGRNAGRIEYIHGGVTRNVVEDIANVELRPTYVSIVDTSALGEDVVRKLKRHKVDTSYVKSVPGGMGTWLAVFDNKGDLAGSISQRPNLYPILYTLEEKGDEIISKADSIVLEMDIDKEIIKKTFQLAQKYNKRVYGVVTNMSIAVERRDYLKHFDCFVCNQIEAGIFYLVVIHGVFNAIVYPISGPLSNGLRAAGDVKFTMIVSIASTLLARFVFSIIFAIYLNMGVIGIAFAMCLDWTIRAVIFYCRYRSLKWLEFKVI